ncbi:MAG: hypothetical protein ACTSY1_02360, partial [Alphaproteobacteria bacterium]
MALIECEDCGAEVSDLAPACIKCGAPIGEALAPPVLRDESGFLVADGAAQQAVTPKSSGGVFEFAGFVLIVAGMVGCVAARDGAGPVSSWVLVGG